MKNKEKPKTLCDSCLGCMRLKKDFQGVYRCKNYMKGRDEHEKEGTKRT